MHATHTASTCGFHTILHVNRLQPFCKKVGHIKHQCKNWMLKMLYFQIVNYLSEQHVFFKKLRRATTLEKLLTGLCVWTNHKINQRQDWTLKYRWIGGWIHHRDRMQGQIFQFNNNISQQQQKKKCTEFRAFFKPNLKNKNTTQWKEQIDDSGTLMLSLRGEMRSCSTVVLMHIASIRLFKFSCMFNILSW